MIEDFTPLAGDRYFGEDHAIFAGLGRFEGRSVAIIGQEKGVDTETRLKHNFGMARPEGYRKAIRIMEMAERYESLWSPLSLVKVVLVVRLRLHLQTVFICWSIQFTA